MREQIEFVKIVDKLMNKYVMHSYGALMPV
jgi:hypothetical protein